MARNYIPPVFLAAALFQEFMQNPESALSESIELHGNPTPTCIMDVLYLWLLDAKAQEKEGNHGLHAFAVCPTFEAYLLAVPMIIDAWSRYPEHFRWPDRAADRYGLRPITEAFPALPDEDTLSGADGFHPTEPERFSRGEETEMIMGAQYVHPALSRDTFDYLRTLAEKEQREYPSDTIFGVR